MMTETGCRSELLIGLGVQAKMLSVQFSRNVWKQCQLLLHLVDLMCRSSLLYWQVVEVVAPDSQHDIHASRG